MFSDEYKVGLDSRVYICTKVREWQPACTPPSNLLVLHHPVHPTETSLVLSLGLHDF